MENSNQDKTVEVTPATEPLTKTIQLEIEKRAKDKYSKEYSEMFHYLLSNPILGKIKIEIGDNGSIPLCNSWGGNALFKEKQYNNGYAEKTSSNYKELENTRIEMLIKEETDLFLEDVKKASESKKIGAPKIPIKDNSEIFAKIKEKEQQRSWLYDFLSTLYKGNDVKQKVEAHLVVIDNEIKNLQWFLNITNQTN